MSDAQWLAPRAFAGAERYRRARRNAGRIGRRNVEDDVQRAEIGYLDYRLRRVDGSAKWRVEPGYNS